jgi:hypothetical protein
MHPQVANISAGMHNASASLILAVAVVVVINARQNNMNNSMPQVRLTITHPYPFKPCRQSHRVGTHVDSVAIIFGLSQPPHWVYQVCTQLLNNSQQWW